MTSNSAFKKQVRDYAAEHGLPYAEARTRLLRDRDASPGGPVVDLPPDYRGIPKGTPITVLKIQQQVDDEGRLPKPFYIDEHGLVGRQDSWDGDPWSLIGFQDPADPFHIVVNRTDWFADPQSVIGLEPVLQDAQRTWSTWTGPIDDVATFPMETTVDASEVHAKFTPLDASFAHLENEWEVTFEVADALAFAPPSLLTALKDRAWSQSQGDVEEEHVDLLDMLAALDGDRGDRARAFQEAHGYAYSIVIHEPEGTTWATKWVQNPFPMREATDVTN